MVSGLHLNLKCLTDRGIGLSGGLEKLEETNKREGEPEEAGWGRKNALKFKIILL